MSEYFIYAKELLIPVSLDTFNMILMELKLKEIPPELKQEIHVGRTNNIIVI